VNRPVPYSDLLGARDPLAILADTPGRIEEMVRSWDVTRWDTGYAPGKWTATQVVLHLAHDEIGWSNRVRLAVTQDGYVAHPYDGGAWVELETPIPPDVALAAFVALRRLDLVLYRRLTPGQRERPISHPEYGQISVEWIIRVLAGHDLHHLQHLRAIADR
jgi:DinB superfamily